MAGKLDISKLAERLAQLNQNNGGGGGSSLGFINIKDGRNVVRILPPKDGAEWFAEEVWVHYGVGKSDTNKKGTMVVCPKTHGDDKPCPVCDLADEIFRKSKKKDDANSKLAKEVRKKKRVYYNGIDRAEDLSKYTKDAEDKWINKETDEEESPVKVLATGVGVYKDLMKLIVDPEYGDVTDPVQGLDIIITKSGTGFNTDYEVKSVRKESAIGFEEWEECLHDLKVLSKTKSYDEILAIMGGASKEEDVEEEEEEPTEDAVDKSADDSENLQDEIQKALQRRKK